MPATWSSSPPAPATDAWRPAAISWSSGPTRHRADTTSRSRRRSITARPSPRSQRYRFRRRTRFTAKAARSCGTGVRLERRFRQALHELEQLLVVERLFENCVRTQFARQVEVVELGFTASTRHGDDPEFRL